MITLTLNRTEQALLLKLLNSPSVTDQRAADLFAKIEQATDDNRRELKALALRVARLNRDAGEIGAGMLAQLVDEARRVTGYEEGKR
jgi:hypothetical protein